MSTSLLNEWTELKSYIFQMNKYEDSEIINFLSSINKKKKISEYIESISIDIGNSIFDC